MTEEEQGYSPYRSSDGPDAVSVGSTYNPVMRRQRGCRMCLCQMNLNKRLPPFKEKGYRHATEAVFGLGCDPDSEAAVQRLLAIKQRPVEKGLILIAADLAQLQDYIDLSQLSDEQLVSRAGELAWSLHLDHARSRDDAVLVDRSVRDPGGAGHRPSPGARALPGIWQTAGVHQCQSNW